MTADNGMAKPAFNISSVKSPSISQLDDLCNDLGLGVSQNDLDGYCSHIAKACVACAWLDGLPEPTPPVKYSRSSGYRPSHSQNPCNAWCWKTEIYGATSGILHGKRIAIKDNIAVADVPMASGSKILEGYIPEYDATVVSRILDAGGLIAGKASCEDCCVSGNSFTSANGPVLNPHDHTRTAGGSSSGSAALIALGEVDMSLGCDQAGSIRIPASACGVVGLKPTYGLVPYTGAISMEPSIDHVGPMANNVADCALLLEAIAGFDGGLDARQHPGMKIEKYTEKLTGNLAGMRIGLLKEGFQNCEQDVANLVKDAAYSLTQMGATIEDASFPMHSFAPMIFLSPAFQGFYNQMVDGSKSQVRGFSSTSLSDYLENGFKERASDLSPTVKFACLTGAYIKQTYNNRIYMKAQNFMRKFTNDYNTLLSSFDVLIMPTLPFKPKKLPESNVSIKDYIAQASECNACAANLTGHPALTVNAGFLDGLPVGMMIVGRHFEDSTVLNIGHTFEKLRLHSSKVLDEQLIER